MPTTIPTTTSSTRPGSPSAGDAYFETDTKNYIIYDGANWRGYNNDAIFLDTVADNYSLLLDGVDDYLTTTHHFSDIFSGSFSISVWVRTPSTFTSGGDTLVGTPFIAGKGWLECRWFRETNTTAKVIMYHTNLAGSSTGTYGAEIKTTSPNLSNDAWSNIIFTADRPSSGTTSAKIYINNSLQATTGGSPFYTTLDNAGGIWDGNVFLGARNQGTVAPMEGHLDNVALFNYALSAPQVAAIYDAGGGGDLSQLDVQHWWKMEEGTGTTVADSGGASTTYTATFNSAPQWSSTVEPN